jgi:Tfp pilus assembly protein PilV
MKSFSKKYKASLLALKRTQERSGGFSLVEIIVAVAFLAVIVTALTAVLFYGEETTALSGNRSRAVFLAEEGLEATRNIRDAAYTNLIDGTYGLATTGNIWVFSGSSDTNGIFTRQIIIGSGGTNRKVATSTVTWQQNLQRSGSVSATTELANWKASAGVGGMLVYGNGGTTTDAISYKVLSAAGTWSSPASSAADVDGGSTNRALRAVQVYASSTRNEKVMLTRHYNGTTQYIYGQVYNGTTWGNVQLMSSWAAATFLDVQNFSGAYLNNGDFMAVFSDNTTTPKFRVWNGTSWSVANIAMQNIGGIPNIIVARARPGTNEVMTTYFDQASDTNSQYFNNSSGYATASWTLHTEHATAAPSNTRKQMDFIWSPNNSLIGEMVYASGNGDSGLNSKIWTANGTGGGAWSATANAGNVPANLGVAAIAGRNGATTFIACDKDDAVAPNIVCFDSSATPAWTNPTNQTIVAGTDTGIQQSFDMAYEPVSGATAVAVYSDTTTTPKLKKYTASTDTWDASATNINALTNALETVRVIINGTMDDMMILMGDTAQTFYSIVWDGTNNAVYTTPTGKAFSTHGTAGSTDEDIWFDFAWDKF